MAVHKTKTGLVFIFIIAVVESQITSSLVAQTVCVGDDVDLDWVYGNAADYSSVTWSHTNSSSNTKTIMQLGLGGGAPTVVDNFNVVHKSNGGITLTNVNEGNSGSYKISVTYLSSSPVEDSVSVTVKDCSNCKCECKCKCKIIEIFSIILGILGASGLATAFIGGILKGCFDKKKTLASDVIGVLCDVVGLTLSIIVIVGKCCEGNCDDSECCEEECCENWIKTSAVAFTVIPGLALLASAVIFFLVWFNIIGPGDDDDKKSAPL